VSGVDWRLLLGIPGAVAAVVTLLLYVVGTIRPLRITSAHYWHTGDTTQFSFTVKNRSLLFDRELSSVSIFRYPRLAERLRNRAWRSELQRGGYVPFGERLPSEQAGRVTVTKHNETTAEGEIRRGTTPGRYELDDRIRLQLYAGSKRSRPRRLVKR
jgi:hypothetical protein